MRKDNLRKNILCKKFLSCFCIAAMLFSSGCGSSAAAADRTASFTSQNGSGDVLADPAPGQTASDLASGQVAGQAASEQETPPGLLEDASLQEKEADAGAADQTLTNPSANENSISYVGDLSSADGEIDVDLTTLSSVVIYSVVFNMMQKPEDYIGKKIRIFGNYSTAYEEQNDVRYHACIIQDATQCCAQGIEFELTDDYVFPDDYPEVWDEIVVVGTFDIYKDGGSTYCTLRNAHLE